jgi:hypothetical protein
MANITFLKTPGKIALTGNPATYKVTANNAYTLPGSKYGGRINIVSAFTAGQSLNIRWLNKVITITCAATPVAFNEIGLSPDITDLYAFLFNFPDLVEDFSIAPGDNYSIDITARKIGADYNLTADGTLTGISLTPVTAGTDKTQLPNFKIITKVEADGAFISEHALPTDTDASETYPLGWQYPGIAEISINDQLQAEKRGHFTVSFPSNEKHHLCDDVLTPFRLYAYAQAGIPPVKDGGLFSDMSYALQGKLENFRQGELNYMEKNFTDLLTETQMFLSFAPSEKITDIYAPERLFFLFQTASTYRLWVEESYTDDTTHSAYRDSVAAAANSLYEFDVSYRAVRTNFDRKLKQYKVWLTNVANEPISEERTFVLDYAYYNNARYFFYMNSLGVYECLRITGAVTKNLTIDKEFVNIPYDKRFTNLDRQEKQSAYSSELVYEMNAGFFPDKYWADYFQQFLTSPDVYWLKKGTAYPASIRPSKNKVSDDGDFNPYAVFELVHSIHDDFTEEFISTEPISIGDFDFDFDTDYFIGTGILYYNEEQSADFTKNDCGTGYNGTTVTYTVAANMYTSVISQADANAKALADIAANGQAYANLYGSCLIISVETLSVVITSFTNPSANGASDGSINIAITGGLAPYTVRWSDGAIITNRENLPDGTYSILVTDKLGNTASASQQLTQPAIVYWNTRQAQSFRRSNCGAGYSGSIQEYVVAANTYSSLISQADANAQALADIQANGQAYANAHGSCILVPNASLDVGATGSGTFQIRIEYADGTSQTIYTAGTYTVKQMDAVLLINADPTLACIVNAVNFPVNAPGFVQFIATNAITIIF